jgi:hypothetical protein
LLWLSKFEIPAARLRFACQHIQIHHASSEFEIPNLDLTSASNKELNAD